MIADTLGVPISNFSETSDLRQDLNAQDLDKLEEKGELELQGETFTPEDVLIFREAKEGTQALSNRFISIDMDCNLTDELMAEGLAREVVNRIQKSRKDLNFNVSDRIKVTFEGDSELEQAIKQHKSYISKETLAKSLEKGNGVT